MLTPVIGLDQLARVGFDTLGLQTYLTAGPKESRAWTIRKGWTAPQAAGVIHTDFEKGFIKAEVVSFDDLDAAGTMAEAKAKGRVRIEGKDYVMVDDVMEFRSGITSGGRKGPVRVETDETAAAVAQRRPAIESVAETGGVLRVLDVTRPRVREAIRDAQSATTDLLTQPVLSRVSR